MFRQKYKKGETFLHPVTLMLIKSTNDSVCPTNLYLNENDQIKKILLKKTIKKYQMKMYKNL